MNAALNMAGLRSLREHDLLGEWEEYHDPDQVDAARRLLVDAIDTLLALGPAATPDHASKVLVHCVRQFNGLDCTFMGPLEREDLYYLLSMIAEFSGLDSDDMEAVLECRKW